MRVVVMLLAVVKFVEELAAGTAVFRPDVPARPAVVCCLSWQPEALGTVAMPALAHLQTMAQLVLIWKVVLDCRPRACKHNDWDVTLRVGQPSGSLPQSYQLRHVLQAGLVMLHAAAACANDGCPLWAALARWHDSWQVGEAELATAYPHALQAPSVAHLSLSS